MIQHVHAVTNARHTCVARTPRASHMRRTHPRAWGVTPLAYPLPHRPRPAWWVVRLEAPSTRVQHSLGAKETNAANVLALCARAQTRNTKARRHITTNTALYTQRKCRRCVFGVAPTPNQLLCPSDLKPQDLPDPQLSIVAASCTPQPYLASSPPVSTAPAPPETSDCCWK